MNAQDLLGIGLVPAALLLFTFYLISVSIYRLYLSPLSNIPGPRLAALTYLYEFYYDAIKGGQMLWKTKELHEEYGPIVRITPNGVHVNDAGFYDTIYAAGGTKHPRNKVRHVAFSENSMFNSFDAGVHRPRRAAIAAPFSKQSVRALEPAIWEIACDYADQLGRAAGAGTVVELKALWNALTQEIIGRYCFGANSMRELREGSDKAQFLGTFDDFPEIYIHAWDRMFPLLLDLIQKVPLSLMEIINPKFGKLRKFDEQIRRQISEVMVRDEPLVGLKNVFHEMRDGKHLLPKDKNEAYYKEEAVSFIGAGTETTAGALATMSYYVLANPHILSRVREELKTVMPNHGRDKMPTVAELEALPYLTGVIQESLRLAFGVPGRLPRTAPTEELVYGNYRLPPGTVVSESSYLIHTDERYYPDPLTFEPERWIGENKHKLASCFVPFSRGGRGCIGINLAYGELYLTAAVMFSRLEMELFETTERDAMIISDSFIGLRPADSKGVRVTVLKEME